MKTYKPYNQNLLSYYIKIWLDIGMWVSSIRIDPVQKLQNYEVRSHRQ